MIGSKPMVQPWWHDCSTDTSRKNNQIFGRHCCKKIPPHKGDGINDKNKISNKGKLWYSNHMNKQKGPEIRTVKSMRLCPFIT